MSTGADTNVKTDSDKELKTKFRSSLGKIFSRREEEEKPKAPVAEPDAESDNEDQPEKPDTPPAKKRKTMPAKSTTKKKAPTKPVRVTKKGNDDATPLLGTGGMGWLNGPVAKTAALTALGLATLWVQGWKDPHQNGPIPSLEKSARAKKNPNTESAPSALNVNPVPPTETSAGNVLPAVGDPFGLYRQ
jgi:hypothetical protein